MALVGGGGEPAHVSEARKKHKKRPYMDGGTLSNAQANQRGFTPTDCAPPENAMAGVQEPGGPPPQGAPADYVQTDTLEAQSLIENWLPYGWDMSAGSATQSQERAIECMTPVCADAYRKTLWTPEMAKQIEESGLKSTFKTKSIKVAGTKPDGAVVVEVEGEQLLEMEGKGSQNRPVKMEYLVKKTDQGVVRITGISEGS